MTFLRARVFMLYAKTTHLLDGTARLRGQRLPPLRIPQAPLRMPYRGTVTPPPLSAGQLSQAAAWPPATYGQRLLEFSRPVARPRREENGLERFWGPRTRLHGRASLLPPSHPMMLKARKGWRASGYTIRATH